jgi:hypothetical protein
MPGYNPAAFHVFNPKTAVRLKIPLSRPACRSDGASYMDLDIKLDIESDLQGRYREISMMAEDNPRWSRFGPSPFLSLPSKRTSFLRDM